MSFASSRVIPVAWRVERQRGDAGPGSGELRGRRYGKVQVRVSNEIDDFTVMVYGERLRQAKQAVRTRYPGSALRIALPIGPGGFLVQGAPVRRARSDLFTGKANPIKITTPGPREIYNSLSKRCF